MEMTRFVSNKTDAKRKPTSKQIKVICFMQDVALSSCPALYLSYNRELLF